MPQPTSSIHVLMMDLCALYCSYKLYAGRNVYMFLCSCFSCSSSLLQCMYDAPSGKELVNNEHSNIVYFNSKNMLSHALH